MMKLSWITIFVVALAAFFFAGASESARIPDSDIPEPDPLAAFRLGPQRAGSRVPPPLLLSCDISRDNCGSITPSDITAWIADGSGLTNIGTLFFVDVPMYGDGVFQVDPATCSVVAGTYYSVSYSGISERGIAYDPEYHDIWHGGWNEDMILQNDADPPYPDISATYTGLSIASMAVDDANNYLFVGTNSYPDYVYVYDITGGALGSLLGAWAVPWQAPSGGWVMAGMEFDPAMNQLVMVNQYGNYSGTDRETFGFSLSEGLIGAGWCDLANTGFGWGIAVVADDDTIPGSSYSYVTDIGDFAAPIDIDEYGIPEVYPPYDFGCNRQEICDILLTWENGEIYDSINVYDQHLNLIAVLPGDATSYTVENVYFNVCDGPDYPGYFVSGIVGNEESGRIGGCGWLWIPYNEGIDFDRNDGGFTAGGDAGWEWGVPSPPGEGRAWETVLGGDYLNNSCGWIESPFMELAPCGSCLGTVVYQEIECEHDGWNFQVSQDGGITWSVLHPYGGNVQGVPTGACEEGLDDSTDCGSGGEMDVRYFDLDAYHGATVKFRFLFESDPQVTSTGLIVDGFYFISSSAQVMPFGTRCELLNPDHNGDGEGDVHLGESLYYRVSFVSQSPDAQEYGIAHGFHAGESCPPDSDPLIEVGPHRLGTLEPGETRTHYFRVSVPANGELLDLNPFAVKTTAWDYDGSVPDREAGDCCFGVTLLPQRKPPPIPVPAGDFVIEEVMALPE